MIHLSTPKISVVICTHNRCDQLRDTLSSLSQTSVPEDLTWELIVVDNNSTDRTKEVVGSFANSSVNPKYLFEVKPGLSQARNRGIAEARGEIISFLDDDVIVDKNWLAQIRLAFEQYNCMCLGGRVFLFGDPKMPRWWHKNFDVAVGRFDRGEQVIRYEKDDEGLIGIGANMSFRRVVFERYGSFDAEMGRVGNQQRTGEETDLVLRLRRNNELAIYYPKALVYHCVPENRFSKKYLRVNAYHFGGWRFLGDLENPSQETKLLGMPLWMYRSAIGAAQR